MRTAIYTPRVKKKTGHSILSPITSPIIVKILSLANSAVSDSNDLIILQIQLKGVATLP